MTELSGTALHGLRSRQSFEVGGVDGNRGPLQPDTTTTPAQLVAGNRCGIAVALGGLGEVGHTGARLKRQHIGSQQAFDDLGAPRKPRKELYRGKRDVEVEADGDVIAQGPKHAGDELQLVILHPGNVACEEAFGSCTGIAIVYVPVRVPEAAVVGGRCQCIVVERPQGAVAEPVVEAGDLLLAQGEGPLLDPAVLERFGSEVGDTRPPHPRPFGVLQDGAEGAYEPARASRPFVPGPGDRKPIGNNHDPFDADLPRAPPTIIPCCSSAKSSSNCHHHRIFRLQLRGQMAMGVYRPFPRPGSITYRRSTRPRRTR